LQQTLFAPSPQSDSQFGYAVAMSDDALFIVSRFDSAFASQAGAVYVFERSGTSWAFVERLGSMTPKPRGGFGQSIAFDGELLGVGELADPGQSGGDQRGSVSTYHRVGNTWQLLERLVPEAGLGSNTARFGAVQDLRNDRLVIGAPDLETSNDQSGFVASWSVIHTETNGTCFDGIECTTGNCVDGVCCDLPCAGTCEACSAAKKGYGEDGVCEPIQAGLDPDEECPADPTAANACAPESACSGDASCSCIVPGTLQCSSEIERIDENGNQVSCVPFRCRANTCLTTCNSSADCSDGARCNSERRCETAENHASSSSDSGCSMGRSGNRAPLWPLGALVALWFIARRRKLAFS
ncbi:MAG: FG-GAP repeat protein, partial [Myxococcales bacterium]|nr:FG-GAP repeat protein [Myxococcales bacterium]